MKVVLDTNVIVSALLIPSNSRPSEIFNLVLNGSLTIVYDNRLFSEYVDVLYREKFNINRDCLKFIIRYIEQEGEFLFAKPLTAHFIDETDKKFYEVYKSGEAQYLITGNIKHFPKETGIVTPVKFLEIWKEGN